MNRYFQMDCLTRTVRFRGHTRNINLQPRLGTYSHRPARHIVYFRQNTTIDLHGPLVRLPLEGQELMGLKTNVVKDSELNTVHELLVGNAMEEGYSEDAYSGRLEVLDFIRHDIVSNQGRVRDTRDLELPVELLPGALALMTEVGLCETALDIGTELLRTSDSLSPAERRDVMLTIALAYCGLASTSLQESNAQVGQSCSYLEAALEQLEAAGEPALAPGLATEIRLGLASLRFQRALEQLSGPLGHNNAELRKRAVRVVRDAIRAQSQAPQSDALGLGLGLSVAASRTAASLAPGPSAVMTVTPEAMETLLSVLSCEEVVHLLEWEHVVKNADACKWLYPGLMEAVSAAHVVHGFVCRQPAYVKMGLALVQQLPTTADLCVVEAVSHVLLGAVNQAVDALKQAERLGKGSERFAASEIDVSANTLPASRDAYRFVVAGSAGSDDGLLPGLCMLTERWLVQAAFPFFRDTSGNDKLSSSLVKYFDDTRVETLLTVYDAKSGGQLAETLSEAFAAIKRGLRKTAASGLLARGSAGTGDDSGPSRDSALAGRKRLVRAVAGGFAVMAAIGVGLLTPPGQRLLRRGDPTQVAVVVKRPVLPALTVAPEDFTLAVARGLLERWQVAKAAALGAQHATDQLPLVLAEPLLGETLDKVATLRSHGAHMRFKLLRLDVLGVKRVASRVGPTVRINAQVEDSADLHNDADGKAVNTCHRVIDAEYIVIQGKDGVWRMTSSSVTERGVSN